MFYVQDKHLAGYSNYQSKGLQEHQTEEWPPIPKYKQVYIDLILHILKKL